MKLTRLALLTAVVSSIAACGSSEQTMKQDEPIWPKLDIQVKANAKQEQRVKTILADMTLEQKVAQMIQPEIRDITVEEMRQYGFGSYLNGGGSFPNGNKHATVQDWVDLAESMYQASVDDSIDGSTIPTIWGTDAVHGHNNVIGATLFPHNIGLGAANNPELIEQIAQITAKEVLATGIDWIFAPTVATVRDDRWGRTYEGYSEAPDIVKSYSASIVKGLQGKPDDNFLGEGRVISTVKHFIGDGGTVGGDDQGNNIDDEQVLFDIHAQGYVGGLTVGAQSVMASFNSWNGSKIHGDKYLLTDVLKDRMGFDGLVVGDWNGHGQIEGCSNGSCPQAINAGVDIIMVPSDWKALYENTIAQVKQGVIRQERIDDAVTRILRVKVRAGLFDNPSPAKRKFAGNSKVIGSQQHRDVARQAVRESLVLLKNNKQLLPLNPNLNVLVAGDAAHNIGKQSGGWTITWQGTNNTNEDFPGGTSIFDGIKQQVESAGGQVELNEEGNYTTKPDVAIVVFGEEPYAEGVGDISDLEYQKGDKTDLALLRKLQQQGIPVVSVFITGRPMWVNAELNSSDAFVAAWLPGSEGNGISEVLFKTQDGKTQYDFTGKLSYSWPKEPGQIVNFGDTDYAPLLPYGFGLKYGEASTLPNDLPEQFASNDNNLPAHYVHKQSLQKGWQMTVLVGAEALAVNANTHKMAGIQYRTMDKLIQEDAFLLTTTGEHKAGIELSTSKHVMAIEKALNESSVLTLEINSHQMAEQGLSLQVGCRKAGNEQCLGSININDELKWLAAKEWHKLNIGVGCLADKLSGAEELFIRFETDGKSEFALSNIQLRHDVTNAQVQCK